ncbi:hypothetical protein [Oceanobacillus jeddahense]|uniref:hypothetical protein n=1 Tax=Oceanobacillus jeddahense TaxID=1462527 RepID=UPI0011DE49C3|nr:hypothetical protein [Oceanobacillus jeddahense]
MFCLAKKPGRNSEYSWGTVEICDGLFAVKAMMKFKVHMQQIYVLPGFIVCPIMSDLSKENLVIFITADHSMRCRKIFTVSFI